MRIHSFAAEYAIGRRLALEAGRLLVRQRPIEGRDADPSTALAANRVAHAHLLAGIRDGFPDDGWLSEETAQDERRLRQERVWLIECSTVLSRFRPPTTDAAVSISLTVASMPVIAITYFADRQALFGAAWGSGAWIEEAGRSRQLRLTAPADTGFRMISPRDSPDPVVSQIRFDLGAEDAGRCDPTPLVCSSFAEGSAELYLNATQTLRDWHCCSLDLIVREAGGTVTDCYGEPLTFNKRLPLQRQGIICCRPGVIDSVLPSVSRRFAVAHASSIGRTDMRPREELQFIK